MKKALSIIALIVCMSSTLSAQDFEKGAKVLSAATGYSGDYGLHTSLSYEWGVANLSDKSSIGVAPYIGYAVGDKKFDYKGAECGVYNNKDIFVAVGANYHYTAIKNLDLYGGFRVGYDIKFDSIDWVDENFEYMMDKKFPISENQIIYDGHVGARYRLFKGLSIDIEAGYGLANISGGLSYSF